MHPLFVAVHHGSGVDSNTGSLRSTVYRVWRQDSVGELLLNCSCMSACIYCFDDANMGFH